MAQFYPPHEYPNRPTTIPDDMYIPATRSSGSAAIKVLDFARQIRAGGKVSVPAHSSSAGRPGDWAAGGGFLYFYIGDGTTHSWIQLAGADTFDNS
jgi:hypothetical protein